MKHPMFGAVVLAAVGCLLLQQGWSESAQPEPEKWDSSGFIQVFEQNAGKLLSGIYRTGGFNNGASTFSAFNDMLLLNPDSVSTIEATVTLLDASAQGSGFTVSSRAALEGFFYWDGTGTGGSSDQTGHVAASVDLDFNITSGQSEARYFVLKCTNASCSTS